MALHSVGLLFSQPPPEGSCRSFSLPTTSLIDCCTSLAPKGKGRLEPAWATHLHIHQDHGMSQ